MRSIKLNQGDRFGRWTVIEANSQINGSGTGQSLCRCECGTVRPVKNSALVNGSSKSCGCANATRLLKHHRTKVATSPTDQRLYKIWSGMHDRCDNPNNRDYHNYGGRGIVICDEWQHDFRAFCDWAIANGYSNDLSIDRINVNGNYAPDNCRWATPDEQNNNRRASRFETYNGKTQTIAQWAREYGMRRSTLWRRIVTYGWDIEKALNTPLDYRPHKSAV